MLRNYINSEEIRNSEYNRIASIYMAFGKDLTAIAYYSDNYHRSENLLPFDHVHNFNVYCAILS